MRFVEFVGKDLFFLPALRALADERAQVLVTFVPGAMCRC
jgi:hypothetical protein